MLEIAGVIALALKNKKLALARGRRPGWFMALTFILWFGLEIAGSFIGVAAGLELLGIYLVALPMAGLGGLVSYLIAKNCRPGEYYPASSMAPPPVFQAQPLEQHATIDIIRDYSMRGDITSWKFILNGETVGSLTNGSQRSTTTRQRQNTLRAVSEDGREYAPLLFDVESGGHAEIHFKGDRFEREASAGILPMSLPPTPPPVPYAPPVMLRTELLAAPAAIDIVRESGEPGNDMIWTFFLNGTPLGAVAQGQTVTAQTAQQQNVLRAVDSRGIESAPLVFAVQNGAHALVRFCSNRFTPESSAGILPLSAPPMYAPPYMQPPAPEEGTKCARCGAPVRSKAQYCTQCGAKQPGGGRC